MRYAANVSCRKLGLTIREQGCRVWGTYMTGIKHFIAAFWILMVLSLPTWGTEFCGTCVSVTDGDTLVINTGEEQSTVRLNGIDAPELTQEYGVKSKQLLEKLVKGKTIRVVRTGMDAYGRMVGDISCEGCNINVEMVRQGAAWHYKRYSNDPKLAEAEQQARSDKRGLWKATSPTPPWQYTQGAPVEAKGPFWISDSGKTHNSTCRYYRNSKGVESATPAGEDCKVCGGRIVKPKYRKKR